MVAHAHLVVVVHDRNPHLWPSTHGRSSREGHAHRGFPSAERSGALWGKTLWLVHCMQNITASAAHARTQSANAAAKGGNQPAVSLSAGRGAIAHA